MSSENIPWEDHAWYLKNELIEMGKIKIELYRFEEALIDLNKAIDIYPKDPFIFIKNGKEKEINRDFYRALDDYDKAIKFNIMHIYRGYAKSRIGDIKGAVKDYEKAERLKKQYYYVYFLRGRIKEQNKNLKGAVKDYLKGALKDYDDAIKINKNKTKKLFAKKAEINLLLGDSSASIKDLNKAIKFYPANENLYLRRGEVKIDIRNFKSAIKDLDTAIKINSELGWAYYDRGYVKNLVAKNSRSIESKIKYFKDSNKDLEKAKAILKAKSILISPGHKANMDKMIDENEQAIKVINENIY